MLEEQGAELAIAAIPTRQVVQKLRAELGLAGNNKEAFLAYSGGACARFVGFLVTEAGNIDNLIALCPITADLIVGSTLWRHEVRRQWAVAKNIMCSTEYPAERADAIWLHWVGSELREVPAWIFSLSCVPLTSDWDGRPAQPKPFCPILFESMARQPAASKWLMRAAETGGVLARSGEVENEESH